MCSKTFGHLEKRGHPHVEDTSLLINYFYILMISVWVKSPINIYESVGAHLCINFKFTCRS